jgi:cell wall-associated NlpC family hydrolase
MTITLPKHFIFRSWLGSLPAFLVFWYIPYLDFPIRVATWALALFFLLGAIFYSWRIQLLRWPLLGVYGLAILFVAWPSAPPADASSLRGDYCLALKSYVGCPYMWGGQGLLGIDCSGLVEKGMQDATAAKGLTRLNPSLVRESLDLYWHRTNAKNLGNGYGGRMFTVTTCPTLNRADYTLLRPGDLAVTMTGDHVLAYLGDLVWIAADPGVGKVAMFKIPEEENSYFFQPMRIVRWKILGS